MNLQKHDAETDMEMNMTPMIDVVFLLIIFFMVITDMTQQDLEDLQLPVAQNADKDQPNPDEFRPIINVTSDGSIYVRREKLYDPENPDNYVRIRQFLSTAVQRMKRADGLPDEPLLIRCDRVADFKHVQKVMEQCGYRDIQLWKIQLAAAEPDRSGK
jgi:biopolymer transport protein ExbD